MVNPNIPAIMDHHRYIIVGQQITIAQPEITPKIRYNKYLYNFKKFLMIFFSF